MQSNEQKPNPKTAKTVAAIDVGANSLRMVIAEVAGDGRIEVLERLQRAVRLGQDTFRRGRLGGESMRSALLILRDYRKLLDLYKIEKIRAVATSAVREASNSDTFLDRIFMATRLQMEVIDTSEESRLTVSAVRMAVEHALGVDQDQTLIVDVGGGSTLLSILQGGEIVSSQSLRLGSIRLQEMFSTSEESPHRSADLLRQHISNALITLQNSLPLNDIKSFVAVGGDVRFAAREIGKPTESADLVIVERADFDEFVGQCERYTPDGLSKRHGIPFAEAETLNPALLVYQTLLHKTGASRMIVSHVSMRDGLLLELAREVTGQEDEALLAGVIHSATAIAEKYHVDLNHARSVAETAARLFDFLQADHGLGARYRLLLRVAGLLHEVGQFVSSRAHHKHSEYLISNSEIFGLNRGEINLVAQIARYHRRAAPQDTHPLYMSQPRETRVIVNKLAAILRVADALVRGNYRRAQDIRFLRQGDEIIVGLPGVGDILLEQRAIAAKGGLFEEVYGMKIRLEEA
ncbi:MAG: Ppx/GppA phosphatase family protein [Thermoguttaceae bacterium]|jgi:exopolyphosphatase/guanosine-5'-triphosphate,3'-diphosphate pyrophosphatase